MITPAHARTMARYNGWMNDSLYAAAAKLADSERKRDLGAFFRSLHGTLNHLLLADRLWLGRFTGRIATFPSLGHELYADFDELRHERAATDAAICAYAASLEADTIAAQLHYRSMVDSRAISLPLALALVHFFNHQTHHRGQAGTLLMQLGVDPGVTDLILMPGVA